MLIDSNILIYALSTGSPKQSAAQQFLDSQTERIFAHQNILETLRVLTHTKFPQPFPINDAIESVELILEQSKVIYPSIETYEIAAELIKKYQVAGSEIFDAYLVATALSNDIQEIASDNMKHLGKYTEVKVINPFRAEKAESATVS